MVKICGLKDKDAGGSLVETALALFVSLFLMLILQLLGFFIAEKMVIVASWVHPNYDLHYDIMDNLYNQYGEGGLDDYHMLYQGGGTSTAAGQSNVGDGTGTDPTGTTGTDPYCNDPCGCPQGPACPGDPNFITGGD